MYCSINDILEHIDSHTLTNITDDLKTGAVNQDVVNAAITQADSFIDSFGISNKLHADFLKTASVVISIFYLFSRTNNMPEIRKIRYDEIVKRLTNLRKDFQEVLEMEKHVDNGFSITTSECLFKRKKWKW